MHDEAAWAVWDRACTDTPGSGLGDQALAALLDVHGIAMNGGLLHSVELHDADELAAGCAGFRFYGLDEAAAAIEQLVAAVAGLDPDAVDERVEAEEAAESRYNAVIPTDDAIGQRFHARFLAHPGEFAPLAP